MSPVHALFLVPVLMLLPGYALLPSGYPRRLRLPFVIFASVAVTSAVGLALMLSGNFSVPLLAALEAPLLYFRFRAGAWPALGLRHHLPTVLLLIVVAIFAVLTSGEPFDGTGDAGVYTISAVHLSETGRWSWPLDEVVPAGVPEELVVYEPPYVRPWREVAPGFIVRGQQVVPQFFPLFPVWGAIFGAWLGMHGVLAANLLGAVMLVLGCDALFRVLLGRGWRFAGLAVLLLNPIFLVFVKYPSAEVFLAGLLAGWLLWMVLFLRAPTARGSLMPAALLALAILTKFFAWAVAGAVVLVCVLLPLRHLRATVGFAVLLPPAFALDAWLATPHLQNHLGQLLILSGFKVVLVGCGLVLLLRLVWSRVARAAPPALAVVYMIALGFLWSSATASHVRDYAALSGPLVLWGAAIGLAWYLWRRRAMWLVLPAFVFVLLSLYLFLGSGDSPYYPFAARRYLPITVPLGALFLGYLVRELALRMSRRLRIARPIPTAIACLLLAVAALPALWVQYPAVLVRHGNGFVETLTELRRVTRGRGVVLATGQAWRYAPHLLLGGDSVFCLDLRPPGVLEVLQGFVGGVPGVVMLTNEQREKGLLGVVAEERRGISQTNSPPLKAALPRTTTFRLFSADMRSWTVPDRLDVGEDDQLSVAGCHHPERAKGRSFRWTGGHARVLVGAGEQLRFVWSRGGNPTKPLPVSVFARGLHIGDDRLADGWQTSRWFDIPLGDGPVQIEIRTPTFQPALLGRGNDRRKLGLCLDAVEIR